MLFGRRLDVPALLRRLVLLVLLAVWLTLTVGKALQYRSEPISSSTYWEEEDRLSTFTVCPAAPVNKTISRILNWGTQEQKAELYGNRTLMEFLWMVGLKANDMLQNVVPTEVPGEFVDFFGTKWSKSVHLLMGGLCATATPPVKTAGLWTHAILKYQPEFVTRGQAYTVTIHGNSEFLGEEQMQPMYILMNGTRLTNIFVATDREVRENLRRAPCEADPNYSQAACEHRSFFSSFNCTMRPSDDPSKRLCMATDYNSHVAYTFFMGLEYVTKMNSGCIPACARERYQISTRPGQSITSNAMELRVQTVGTRKVLVTRVSYTAYDLAADMGGFLGLFVGWSLFSLFELLQSGLGWARGMCKRRSIRPTTVSAIERGQLHQGGPEA